MTFARLSRPRIGARLLCTALLASTILAAGLPAPAAAWILRYTTGYGFVPNPPLSTQPTTFLLYGYYPGGCGAIVSSRVVDPSHVEIHLRSDDGCPDSSRTDWVERFPLGMLPQGNRELTITMTMDHADSSSTQTASFEFGVEDSANVPPPPPPPPPPALPLVSSWTTDPSPAMVGEPVRLIVTGYTPFPCAMLSNAAVIDSSHATLTMTANSCADTLSGWTQAFELGMKSAGHHVLDLAVTQVRDTGTTTVHVPITYLVVDSVQVPPPPGPALVTGWSTDPAEPVPTHPVRLIVRGNTPFPCATLSNAAVLDSSRATITMTAVTTPCPDSLTGWTYAFDLGLEPPGHHILDLEVVQVNGSTSSTVHVPMDYLVFETGMVPPPPPDSLVTVLSPGRPNPFAAESHFSVSLQNGMLASVAVFDVNGRRVRTVFDGQFAAGTTQLSWDGRREDGSRAPSGLYFYRLVMPGRVISRRVVLLPTP